MDVDRIPPLADADPVAEPPGGEDEFAALAMWAETWGPDALDFTTRRN